MFSQFHDFLFDLQHQIKDQFLFRDWQASSLADHLVLESLLVDAFRTF